MADGFQIHRTELRFKFELRKTIPVALNLTNQGNERIAFKVKTTSPKKYCVRPSSGIVEPGSSRDVQVRRCLDVSILKAASSHQPCQANML